MDFDVVAYLASKGLRGRAAAGGREMVYPCFFEGEPPDSKKRKLYVHVADGFYHCKTCDISGGSFLLQQHFGDDPSPGSTDDPFVRRRILDSATKTGQTMLLNNDDALLYLMNERGLTAETISTRKLGMVAGGWSLVGELPEGITAEQVKTTGLVHRDGSKAGKDFFWRHLLIPYLSHGHTIQMRGRVWGESSGGKYMTGPGDAPRLYNADSLDGAEEVIVTEGEFDAIILAQALADSPEDRARRIAVVGLPGVSSIPEDFEDLLSGAKRIYLGFDSDDAGKRAAEKLKESLGNRVRILQLPFMDGRKCDWTEYLLPAEGPGDWRARHPYAGNDWKDVLRLLTTAAGKRIFSVAEARMAYMHYREQHSGIPTGYSQLDGAIHPGMLPGQVMVILAKTGTGKTLFLCNLAVQMRAERILFVSLEMTREEVYDRLRRIYQFHHPSAGDDAVDAGLANIYICDENRLGERDLAILVSEFAVEAEQPPTVVMVDYLGYYARGFKGNSQYEKATNAIMQLKADAKAGRYTVITPSQVNRLAKEGKPITLDDARDSGAVEETADFLLSLFRPDEGLQVQGQDYVPSGKVRCAVLKSRHGGKGQIFSFQMDLLTLAIVNDDTDESKRAVDHNYQARRGWTWERLRQHETRPRQLALRGEVL